MTPLYEFLNVYIQHGLLYFFICIVFATIIDHLFPKANENKPRWKTILEVILQLLSIILVMEQLIFPFVLSIPIFLTGYQASFQWFPAVIVSAIYVGTQVELRKKIMMIQQDIINLINLKPLRFIPKLVNFPSFLYSSKSMEGYKCPKCYKIGLNYSFLSNHFCQKPIVKPIYTNYEMFPIKIPMLKPTKLEPER